MNWRKGLVSFVGMAALLVGVAACGSSSKPQASSAAKNAVAVYGSTSSILGNSWDPAISYSNEIIVMANVYQGLLSYNPTTKKFTGVLATSWNESKDGLTWTFNLRHNVHFHDGTLMTSKQVAASLERTIKLGQSASYIWDGVKSIAAPSEYQVVFHLSSPSPIDFAVASPYAAWIYNTAPLASHGKNYFQNFHDDGTGPYEFASNQNGTVVLKQFKGYWGGWKGAHYTKVVFEDISSSSTMAQDLTSGQLTYAETLPYNELKALKTNPNVRETVTPSFQNLMAFLNMKKPPLTNPKVREALSYAFPYRQVIQDVMHGQAIQGQGPIPHGLWGHDSSLPVYHQDLSKAKTLLQEAGIKPGSLTLTLTYTAGDPNEQAQTALYKAALQQIGVTLAVRPMPWTAQWAMAKDPNVQNRQDIFEMYWWPDYTNPYSFVDSMFHCESTIVYNVAYYCNAQFDRDIDAANTASGVNLSRAERLYSQAQQILFGANAAIYIYDEDYVRATAKSMKGFVDNPSYPNVVFWYDTHPSS